MTKKLVLCAFVFGHTVSFLSAEPTAVPLEPVGKPAAAPKAQSQPSQTKKSAGGAEKKTDGWKTADEVLAKMEEAEKLVQSVSFRYEQSIHIEATGEATQAAGQASFLRPNKFRFEQETPQAQTVVSDGQRIWIFNPATNEGISQSVGDLYQMPGVPQGLTPFQSDITDYRARFNISLEKVRRPGAPEEKALKLEPKQQDANFPYTLHLWIDPASGLPGRTELTAGSVRVATAIGQIKVNPALTDADFTFTAPKGAQMMEVPFERSEK